MIPPAPWLLVALSIGAVLPSCSSPERAVYFAAIDRERTRILFGNSTDSYAQWVASNDGDPVAVDVSNTGEVAVLSVVRVGSFGEAQATTVRLIGTPDWVVSKLPPLSENLALGQRSHILLTEQTSGTLTEIVPAEGTPERLPLRLPWASTGEVALSGDKNWGVVANRAGNSFALLRWNSGIARYEVARTTTFDKGVQTRSTELSRTLAVGIEVVVAAQEDSIIVLRRSGDDLKLQHSVETDGLAGIALGPDDDFVVFSTGTTVGVFSLRTTTPNAVVIAAGYHSPQVICRGSSPYVLAVSESGGLWESAVSGDAVTLKFAPISSGDVQLDGADLRRLTATHCGKR